MIDFEWKDDCNFGYCKDELIDIETFAEKTLAAEKIREDSQVTFDMSEWTQIEVDLIEKLHGIGGGKDFRIHFRWDDFTKFLYHTLSGERAQSGRGAFSALFVWQPGIRVVGNFHPLEVTERNNGTCSVKLMGYEEDYMYI